MDSQELQGWEIAQERVADFTRERARTRLAVEFGKPEQADDKRLWIPTLFNLLSALGGVAWHWVQLNR